jgi:hypothetical protein
MKYLITTSALISTLCTTIASGQTAQSWTFDTDPFATSGGWHINDKPGRWSHNHVAWDAANQKVRLQVVDGIGAAMFTAQSFKPGTFDFKAKIINEPGIASCFWTYLDTPYYSEIDLEITASPSHRSHADTNPGTLVDATDTCPNYPLASAGQTTANVVRFTSYNNKDTSSRYTTVWQDVQRPGIDLTEDIYRTYRFAWHATGDIHQDRIEYWIGDGAKNGESMNLIFALYADKVRFYDNRIKTNTGDVDNDYYMERRSTNTHGDYTNEIINGQTRKPGMAYTWNNTTYDETDATEFQNYAGTMKPCIPAANYIAPVWIAPWCPHWSGETPAGTFTMLVDSVTYTPTSRVGECDINQDGSVDAQDLEALRACLGICSGDTDASGTVDVLDLLQVIDEWGECSPAP